MHLGQQGHINLSKSYATSLLVLYAALQAIVFEIFPSSSLLKGGRCPPCSILALFLACSITLMTVSQTFSRLHHCVSVPFHLHASQNVERKMLGRKGGKKEGDHRGGSYFG